MKTQSKQFFKAHKTYLHSSSLFVVLICFSTYILPSSLLAQTWNALGPGLNWTVNVIYPHGDDVYAGGAFTNAGGNPDADYLARWDGQQWHAVAPGLSGAVTAIGVLNDLIYVGGSFQDVAGNPSNDNIVFWNGSEWKNLGPGLDYYVSSIVILGEDVYVGGGFNAASGNQDADIVARWDGVSWHPLGTGPLFAAYDFAHVSDMATNGTDLYVTGLFEKMGGVDGADRVARWDGNQWHSLDFGIAPSWLWNDWFQIAVDDSHVYVSGSFRDAGGNSDADYIVRWNGTEWEGLTTLASDSTATDILIYDDYLYTNTSNTIKRWNIANEEWEVFANIESLYTLSADSTNLYAGGLFEQIEGEPFLNIARWGEEDSSTGVFDFAFKYSGEIYITPNPSRDVINYQIFDSTFDLHSISIVNSTGESVFSEKRVYPQLDISFLPSGIYFIKVGDEKFHGFAKLIKL